ncbi:membrane progestin receptor beta-like [Ruditapes philippinarum]|uniref:membrane progestin receptor beta-like n=1 Tax=Ruditapes philippinarum TaxID=129788 RepID=UPI00295B13DD|nr:membrane progestin receptor beta-like [Ruditapes philippinarum]XP_060605875.1 membrane progestin receptor beta-like [Ruditapes philippinarum]
MTLNVLRRTILKEFGSVEQFYQTQSTESHQNTPDVYREPAILSGYRIPDKSWRYYTVSIFHLHNETINIWTHIIATLVFINRLVHILEIYDVESECGILPLAVFCACAAANSFLSAFAHTFQSMSPFCHYICFHFDYVGVGIYALCQCILFMYISCPDAIFEYLSMASLPLNVVLSLFVMLGGSLSKILYRRPYPFKRRLVQIGSGCIHASFSCIPLITRLAYCINTTDCNNTHHFPWMVSMAVCLFFFSSHLPEKLAPGKFDFMGMSHQWFHVFQTLTVLLQMNAAREDLRNNVSSIWSCHHVSSYHLVLPSCFMLSGVS